MLYLIPTPVGNLEDMTLRGLRILKEVQVILAEDTRNSGQLLKHFEIKTSLKPFHAHNEHYQIDNLMDQLKSGIDMALISDAGTPGISDPGFLLVRACHQHGIPISVLPGATAFVPALVASGLPCDRFHFEGFLPHKKGRQTRLKYLTKLPETVILYESPHRLLKCLAEFAEFSDLQRQACVVREISKIYESVKTGTIEFLIKYYQEHPSEVRGEIVMLFEGAPEIKKEKKKYNNSEE